MYLQQAEEHRLNVFTDVASLCDRGRVTHRVGNFKELCDRLCEESFARAGWPKQENIALVEKDRLRLDLCLAPICQKEEISLFFKKKDKPNDKVPLLCTIFSRLSRLDRTRM